MNHKHSFRVSSAHRTSEGVVRYLACSCGVRRIDLDETAIALRVAPLAVELRA